MDDQSDDLSQVSARRVEIFDGSGRRRWSDEIKAQIVADSLSPDAVVTEVARRHGCRASQVHEWRRSAREGRLVLPPSIPLLAQVVVEKGKRRSGPMEGEVVVELAEAQVRISGRPGVAELTDVFTALRKASSC